MLMSSQDNALIVLIVDIFVRKKNAHITRKRNHYSTTGKRLSWYLTTVIALLTCMSNVNDNT